MAVSSNSEDCRRRHPASGSREPRGISPIFSAYQWGEERSEWVRIDGTGFSKDLSLNADFRYGTVAEGPDDEVTQRTVTLECHGVNAPAGALTQIE